MAAGVVSATFLWATPYEMAYLLDCTAGAGDATANLDAAGAATPDPATDSVGQRDIHAIMVALYADQPAARAAFGMGAATAPNPIAAIEVHSRTGVVDADWKVDLDVTAPNSHPRFTIHAMAGAATAILTIKALHSVGKAGV